MAFNLTKENLNQVQQNGVVFATGRKVKPLTRTALQKIAQDAAAGAVSGVTTPNAGLPAMFTTYVHPRVIETLLQPMKMATAFPEYQCGDFSTTEAIFPLVENTGEVVSYGDFNNGGMSDANVNFITRQPYNYQTWVQAGSREIQLAAKGRIDWVTAKQNSAVLALNKFQNQSYIFGVKGLKCYGLLNDPSLPEHISDTTWNSKDASAVYESVQALYKQLVKQAGGLVDRGSPLTLLLSPMLENHFTKTNTYNVNVYDQLVKNFPGLKIVTVPEYETAAGEYVQLILDEFNGQNTVELGFTDKLRVHELEKHSSSMQQKYSQGTAGAIVYRPLFVATMLVAV